MTTTHEDNASSWRDLSDQLTPEQIAELEYCEREQIPPGMTPAHQLREARKLAELNIVRAMFADIAPPADVIGEIDDWMDYDENRYQRMFTSWTHSAGDVSILGLQFSDGSVERSIFASMAAEDMTAEQSRQLAAALIEAADEIEARR